MSDSVIVAVKISRKDFEDMIAAEWPEVFTGAERQPARD